MNDAVATRMAGDREKLDKHEHGGLDDLHTELGKSPIHEAAREGDLEEMRQLIASDGIQLIHKLDQYGLTPLHWASDRAHTLVAESLIDQGADVNTVEKRLFRRTPLHFAAVAPSLELVALLLTHGADVNATEYRGWTALHYAAHCGAVDVLRCLLSNGANTIALTKAGETALHTAARNGSIDSAVFLCEQVPALLLLRDHSGATAIDVATSQGHVEFTQSLRSASVQNSKLNDADLSTSTLSPPKSLLALDGVSTSAAAS